MYFYKAEVINHDQLLTCENHTIISISAEIWVFELGFLLSRISAPDAAILLNKRTRDIYFQEASC